MVVKWIYWDTSHTKGTGLRGQRIEKKKVKSSVVIRRKDIKKSIESSVVIYTKAI